MAHVLTEMTKEVHDGSFYIVNHDYESFSKKWFEMEVTFPQSSLESVDSPSPPHSQPSSVRSDPYYMEFDQAGETYGE